MVEIISFDPVEELVAAYLFDRLGDGTPVSTRVPVPRPSRFVTARAAGGGDRNLVLSSRMVIFQCWDDDDDGARRLSERAFSILKAAQRDREEPAIRQVTTIGAPQSFPDPDTSMPRHQFTLQFDIRGRVTR
ncbi:hypothetical protein [Rhodococcus sp. 27YEA15]|uniref:hypothetical protein n=1 Tax=Rhodococcus sp. 27YEA15 TaxID=3156259 RepID=UPI003C7ACF8C